MMSEALPEPKKFSELSPEQQAAVKAVVHHPTRHDWRFAAIKEHEEHHVTAWYIGCYSHLLYGRTGNRKWTVVGSYTVEDYGDHYRTRENGRYGKWLTVPKTPTAASNPPDRHASP